MLLLHVVKERDRNSKPQIVTRRFNEGYFLVRQIYREIYIFFYFVIY